MAVRDAMVYVCGESSLVEGFSAAKTGALRELLLAELAVCWSTRTHGPPTNTQDQRQADTSARLQVIARSHVFVFIYSKETITNSFYLEQYGAAKSHYVPVIGVRLTNYFMPSHLPDQYYFTEIVNCTGKETLADALISDFKSAMVYARDFHKSCVERLRNKITYVCSKTQRENHFFAAMNESTPNSESKTRPMVTVKCPKCGFFVRPVTPKLQRASSTGALIRRSDDTDSSSVARKLASARRRNPFLPAPIHMPSPFSTKKVPLFVKTANGNSKQCPVEPLKVQTKSPMVPAEKQEDCEEKHDVPPRNSDAEKSKSLRRQSRMTNTWTDKLRSKLRRQSSLPVIPTTYLVTTAEGLEKQVSFVKYPPDKPSPRGSDALPIFSEDEELEIIHISRVPSPDIPST